MPVLEGVGAGAALLAAVLASGGVTELLELQDPALTESSGLAVSGRHRGILWTHNDGGRVARVMAVDRRGRTVATVQLRGIDPFDPEAIAPGKDPQGKPALFLGDIGDNRAVRPDVSVFRFREPAALRDRVVDATWFRFTYPDGPHDAEALLVNPRDGRLWIATKDFLRGGLYRAPKKLRTDRPNRLERVGQVPPLVTDGAFLPDGRFVLRTYTTAYVYRAPGRLERRFELPEQEQGESVAVDGGRLLVGSEGVKSPVYAVPLAGVRSSPTASPSRSAAVRSESGRADGGSRWPAWAGAGGAALVVLVAVAALRRRRR